MIVQTLSGKVEGIRLNGAYVFRGIPYAAPPVGELRFKPPVPPQSWSGVRQCDQFGPIAPQRHDPLGFMPELPQSEDCLNLNVWTQGADDELRPVIVYIHGGGFVSGKGAECDGLRYAAEDGIVYVSINYRLGALGFLYLGELLGEGYETSGNNGMLDIVAALKWVQRNIAAFGGDPSRVTVMGNSAGAKCTATLYTMESARGLFHGAVAQSGATQSIRDRRTANVTTLRLLDMLGLSADTAAQLVELSAQKLIEAQLSVGPDTARSLHMFGPVSDGLIIPENPLASLAERNDLPPLFIGSNEDEAALFILFDPHLQAPAFETLERLFGQNAPIAWDVYQRYAELMPAAAAWNKTLTEHLYTIGAIQLAGAAAETGNAVWMYRLQYGGSLGAIHGYEGSLIHAVFTADTRHELPAHDPYAVSAGHESLARGMRAAWIAFVKSGNPNVQELPEWTVYGPDRTTMVLDRASRVRADLPEPAGLTVPHQAWRMG